jgi:hypothetical protein
VTFFDYNDKPIPYARVSRTKAEMVVLNVEFAKADSSGFGRRTRHMRQDANKDVCVVCILEAWIANTRDNYDATEDLGIYEVPYFGTLPIEDLQKIMQATVDDLSGPGSKTKRVTSHSLRYGGATMMAAAGFPHYVIAIYGGWSIESKTLRLYTKPSEQMTESVSAHMTTMALTNASTFFINDAIVIAKTSATA